ncbi:MAG TPA: polymer-forming cytoskeletal protein [Anaerolineae bacterium]
MKRFAVILLLLFLLLVPAGIALAAPPFDTVVEEGEVVNHDIIVFEGDVEVREGATVNGDIIVFNGNATIAGTINGDLVLFNGNLEAAGTAELDGDCVLLNGHINAEAESRLNCSDVENLPVHIPGLLNSLRPFAPPRPQLFIRPFATGGFLADLAEATGRSLLLGLLAFVVASLLPEQTRRTSEAIRRRPVASGAVGLLTAVAVPSLAVLLLLTSIVLLIVCIGLIGFPIVLAMLLALTAAVLFGWIAVGHLFGQRLAEPLRLKNRSLPVAAALGTAVLTFILGLMGAVPFVFGAGLLTFLALCLGLGGTALTQFGTRPYPAAAIQEDEAKVTAVLETLPAAEDNSLQE